MVMPGKWSSGPAHSCTKMGSELDRGLRFSPYLPGMIHDLLWKGASLYLEYSDVQVVNGSSGGGCGGTSMAMVMIFVSLALVGISELFGTIAKPCRWLLSCWSRGTFVTQVTYLASIIGKFLPAKCTMHFNGQGR